MFVITIRHCWNNPHPTPHLLLAFHICILLSLQVTHPSLHITSPHFHATLHPFTMSTVWIHKHEHSFVCKLAYDRGNALCCSPYHCSFKCVCVWWFCQTMTETELELSNETENIYMRTAFLGQQAQAVLKYRMFREYKRNESETATQKRCITMMSWIC